MMVSMMRSSLKDLRPFLMVDGVARRRSSESISMNREPSLRRSCGVGRFVKMYLLWESRTC